MTTVVDYLREQGIEQGIEQGLQQGRQEDIEKLLSKGVLSPEVIASTLEVDLAWVEEISRQLREHK
ncbi:MAG: Rpn family recombination-promoting nuclease/putative transposase [Leptospirillia bacterium]